MLNKWSSVEEALAPVQDGAIVLIGGFGDAGTPTELIHALIDQGASELTVVSNNAGSGDRGLAGLLRAGRVRRLVCSYPRPTPGLDGPFTALYREGKIELELVPQGTLAERLRAAGAGIPAFFTPTAAESEISANKEIRVFNGRPHVLECALRGDVALIKAQKADRWGNLTYNMAARNFSPIMAMAADRTVVQVRTMVDLGDLDPETIITPGIFVRHVVHVPTPDEQGKPSTLLEVAS